MDETNNQWGTLRFPIQILNYSPFIAGLFSTNLYTNYYDLTIKGGGVLVKL